jgi:alpha-1,3-glucan synthase
LKSKSRFLILLAFTVAVVSAFKYNPEFDGYNLNQNRSAEHVLDYWGEWPNHTYHRSPSNWRFPFYTLFLDRFVDGDPADNDINGTLFETDPMSNQFRFGGDLKGLEDTLDYIQGMGIQVSERNHSHIHCSRCIGHIHRRYPFHEPALESRRLLGKSY